MLSTLAAGSVADTAEVRKNVKYAVSTLYLPASSGLDLQRHGEIDDSLFQRFGSPIGREITRSTRERFPVPEGVFGYSQRERLQHFADVPW